MTKCFLDSHIHVHHLGKIHTYLHIIESSLEGIFIVVIIIAWYNQNVLSLLYNWLCETRGEVLNIMSYKNDVCLSIW